MFARLWKPLTLAAFAGTVAVLWIGQTATPLEASGQSPHRASNSTNGAFTLTAVRTTAVPADMYSLGPGNGKKFRMVKAAPYGAGTATQTFDYKVWVVSRGYTSASGTAVVDYEKQLFCHGTATLGATAGVASAGGILTTDLACDTLTVTMDAFGTAVVTAFGGNAASVYSPGGGGQAWLFLPELGNASDIIIEYDMTGATSGNFLIERGT